MQQNTVVATIGLLKAIKIKHTKRFIKDTILSDQNFTSLSSISKVLNLIKIQNKGIQIPPERLPKLPLPCIIQVLVKGQQLFYVIVKTTKNEIAYINDHGKKAKISLVELKHKFTGICLIVEKTKVSKQPSINNIVEEKRIKQFLALFTFILLIAYFFRYFFENDSWKTNFFLLIINTLGALISAILLWHEVDHNNYFSKKFCSNETKSGCNTVLDSKYTSIFWGQISLSLLGFSFFLSSLLCLILTNFSIEIIQIVSILSFISAISVPVLLYYQRFIIKEWCKFCLAIQLILITEFFIFYYSGYTIMPFSSISMFSAILYSGFFLLCILSWRVLKPILHENRKLMDAQRELMRLKSNPIVFENLLKSSTSLSQEPKGLGINLNNQNSKFKILTVCNPYCSPCSTSHKILHDLFESGVIDLQIVFTASNHTLDQRADPVKHFLAINQIGKNDISEALKKWYQKNQMNYKALFNEYPMDENILQNQKAKIDAMNNWCISQNIEHTPTIYINGYKLPFEYDVNDLLFLIYK